jgi:superfamily II DNA or RNA helicase
VLRAIQEAFAILSAVVPAKESMLKIFLPPNFKAAYERDAVAVKLELDLSVAPAEDLLPALALLQRWCGAGAPPVFLQLKRAQLEELVGVLEGKPVFFPLNAPSSPLGWVDGRPEGMPAPIRAVQEAPHLSVPETTHRPKPVFDGHRGLLDGSEYFLSLTLPSKDHPAYVPLLDLLKQNGFVLEPSNRKWWLRDRHKTLRFLAEHGGELRERYLLEETENFKRNTSRIKQAEMVCAVEKGHGGYSLTMSLRAGAAEPGVINAALSSDFGYVEDKGMVYLLDVSLRQKAKAAQRALSGDAEAPLTALRNFKIQTAGVPEANDLLEELSPNFKAPEEWQTRSRGLRSLTGLPLPKLPADLDAQLRSYQRAGTAWLAFLRDEGLGGILADEMGLGKTLQALGLLVTVKLGDRPGCCLVVAPASLLENWKREARRFTPDLRLFVHHGQDRIDDVAAFSRYDLVVTSYGTLARDKDLFSSREFPVLIADEAQHIKNRRSLNAQALRSVPAAARFLLTGTPLENSLDDLRSLFDFLLPGYLPSLPSGLRSEERSWHDERLLKKTAPYILRRTKAAVASELPPKLEQTVWCDLLPAQAALYRKFQEEGERSLMDMEAGGASEARLRFAMLTQLLRLRQICCDPRLVFKTRENVSPNEKDEKQTPSAKTALLLELLDEALDDGHRVLIFSQFTSMLDLLGEGLAEGGIEYCRLDGSMNTRQRQLQIDRFQTPDGPPVFLLSLKAGGTGLNLTAADTVIHFDPWWNPAAEAQATDRAHRIGQTRTVTSYKLICSGTVEERVLSLQERKRALLADVFEASDEAAARLGLSDLRDLLGR